MEFNSYEEFRNSINMFLSPPQWIQYIGQLVFLLSFKGKTKMQIKEITAELTGFTNKVAYQSHTTKGKHLRSDHLNRYINSI